MPVGTGYSALGFQVPWASLSPDTTINDGNTATGKDQTVGVLGDTASVTGGIALGSLMTITGVEYDLGVNSVTSAIAVEVSPDSTTWTSLTATAPTSTGTFAVFHGSPSAGLPAAGMEFVRVSISCTAPGGSGVFSHAAVREITVTAVTPSGRRRTFTAFI